MVDTHKKTIESQTQLNFKIFKCIIYMCMWVQGEIIRETTNNKKNDKIK